MTRRNHNVRFKNHQPCDLGYKCQLLRQNACTLSHTDEQKSYRETLNFLSRTFTGSSKYILGTVVKLQDNKYKFKPLNEEILQRYPDIHFIVASTSEESLSEKHYYEVAYEDQQNEDGEIYVNVREEENYWGKVGRAGHDIDALHYGQSTIYKDRSEFSGEFTRGVVKEKFNGTVAIKSDSSTANYFFLNDEHQNRALPGSTVEFIEVKSKDYNHNKFMKNRKWAQVVSILRCPFDEDYIYGILEISRDPAECINMRHLYCPLPEDIEWSILDRIFMKTGRTLIDYSTTAVITVQNFLEICMEILRVDSENSDILYLRNLIFNDKRDSEEVSTVKIIWNSLYELWYQWQKISTMQTCFFKPLNKTLPIFKCMYIQDELKKDPQIFRKYVMAKFIRWPSSSQDPWVVIEDTKGFIGDPQSDARVILEKNRVTSDEFPRTVIKHQDEIVKNWEAKIKERLNSSQKIEEKIFTIDGESTKNRDDALSVMRLSEGSESYYRVGIHIADVTRVVEEKTEIHKEAEKRFHSNYIGRNFYKPMLPYKLQKHLSLQQGRLTYAFSMYLWMNDDGVVDLEKTEFKHTIIKPDANLTYREVDRLFFNPQEDITKCDAELKKSLFLMRDLAIKLYERRSKLGYNVDISDENDETSEKNSQTYMLVQQFMVLANEIATDYVEYQADILEKKLIKVRNEEKMIAREELKKREEEQKRAKEEKKAKRLIREEEKKLKKEKEKKAKEEKKVQKLKKIEEKKVNKVKKAKKEKKERVEKVRNKVKVKKIVEKKMKKIIVLEDATEKEVEEIVKEEVEEEIEIEVDSEVDVLDQLDLDLIEEGEEEDEEDEEEEEFEEEKNANMDEEDHEEEDEHEEQITEEEISENEEEAKSKVSEEEDDIYESESDDNSTLVNMSKIEENAAISACYFLQKFWSTIDKNKTLDLTSPKGYSESVRDMLEDKSIKSSIRKYLRYLLRLNNRKIELYLSKNKAVKVEKIKKISQISGIETSFKDKQAENSKGKAQIVEKELEEQKSEATGNTIIDKFIKKPIKVFKEKFLKKETKHKQEKKSKKEKKDHIRIKEIAVVAEEVRIPDVDKQQLEATNQEIIEEDQVKLQSNEDLKDHQFDKKGKKSQKLKSKREEKPKREGKAKKEKSNTALLKNTSVKNEEIQIEEVEAEKIDTNIIQSFLEEVQVDDPKSDNLEEVKIDVKEDKGDRDQAVIVECYNSSSVQQEPKDEKIQKGKKQRERRNKNDAKKSKPKEKSRKKDKAVCKSPTDVVESEQNVKKEVEMQNVKINVEQLSTEESLLHAESSIDQLTERPKETLEDVANNEEKKAENDEKSSESSTKDSIKIEDVEKSSIERSNLKFNIKDFEDVIKRYNKLRDYRKMKFTSPIRKFIDILVHQLINDILKIDKGISDMSNLLQKKILEQEGTKVQRAGKKKAKKTKVKSRYQLFQELDAQLKGQIKQIEKSQQKIKTYYEENRDVKRGGMDRAEREIEVMEVCKSIINGADSAVIETDAIVVNLYREDNEVRVFLLDPQYGLECALSNRSSIFSMKCAKIQMSNTQTISINQFDEIKVRLDVKRTFPLNFEVTFVSKI